MTIWEMVKNALVPLGYPLAANTYVVESGANLPDLYIVYQLVSSPPVQSANDREKLRLLTVQVTCWSRTGFVSMPNIVGAMESAGFTHGPDFELPYSIASRHYGLAMEFSILYVKE